MTYLVGIAGGSGAGKGTIATLIKKQLELWGLICSTFSTDDAYIDLSWKSAEERHAMSFDPVFSYDCPEVINFPKIVSFAQRILAGEGFFYPKYNFGTHCYDPNELGEMPANQDVAILEGIYALWSGPPIGTKLIQLYNHRLFVETDARTAQRRRLKRDIKPLKEGGRGKSMMDAMAQLEYSVDPMNDKFVAPTRNNADDVIDWRANESKEEGSTIKQLLGLSRSRAIYIYEEVCREQNKELLLPELSLGQIEIKIL